VVERTKNVAERIVIDPSAIENALLARAAEAITRGDVVAYPTETFYGLAADPRNAEAVERVFVAKGRRSEEPLPLIAADTDTVERWFGALTPRAAALAHRFWPGPLTLVLPLAQVPALPQNLTAGRSNIAVRVPAHPLARALARAAGGVITSTSANRSGEPPVSTADEVLRSIGDRIALVIDGGPTPGGAPSTIVDVTGAQPRLVRAGSVPWERVLESLQ
jgi:L-threonylcarbamoyladenylate synthase